MISEQLDKLIFSATSSQWQKTAMVIARVSASASGFITTDQPASISDRIKSLVETGKLEARGDLSDWRHSEVRLPG